MRKSDVPTTDAYVVNLNCTDLCNCCDTFVRTAVVQMMILKKTRMLRWMELLYFTYNKGLSDLSDLVIVILRVITCVRVERKGKKMSRR